MPRFGMIGPVQIQAGIVADQIIPFRCKSRIIKFIAVGYIYIPILASPIQAVVYGFQIQPLLVFIPHQVLDCTVLHGHEFADGKFIERPCG